jgi:hypothetical protein
MMTKTAAKFLRLTHPMSNGGTITFSARIVKREADGAVWVEIPARVRAVAFPPVGGKRYAKFAAEVVR